MRWPRLVWARRIGDVENGVRQMGNQETQVLCGSVTHCCRNLLAALKVEVGHATNGDLGVSDTESTSLAEQCDCACVGGQIEDDFSAVRVDLVARNYDDVGVGADDVIDDSPLVHTYGVDVQV
jgi:hypothetical protein